ncbi:rhamnogalacturonan lyase B N-terminal domain-containing protein [Vibrio sp. PP-XX7]
MLTGTASLLIMPKQVFHSRMSGEFYTVDTNAGVVFSIRRTDNGKSTQSAGDIASLKIDGKEFQDQSRGSQINSGFDWLYKNTSSVSVSAKKLIRTTSKITVTAGDLAHGYLARNGYANIYMAHLYFTRGARCTQSCAVYFTDESEFIT